MPTLTLKLTEELAADIKARVKAVDFGSIEKARKTGEQNGTFDVIISTEDTDRSGEIVKQSGWELVNYKNNPIVLWGHDYYSLPIGVCTETYLTEKDGVPALGARGVFLSAEINPFAQQVRKLYEFGIGKGAGVGCTTSVGFIPKEFDENARNTITKAELLEFSFVPIPANQGVGPAAGRALTFDEAKELQLDVAGMRLKGLEFTEADKKECKGAGACEDGECDHGEKGKKDAKPGDSCSTDDGSPGILTTDPKDPEGALVCLPQDDDKSKAAGRASRQSLLKATGEEHERHSGEVEDLFDEYKEKPAADKEARKDLSDSLRDEHDMHRAKMMACFRSFNPAEDKAFDKKPHLKALREEHDAYDAKCEKSFDEFAERGAKAEGEEENNADKLADTLESHRKAHKKAVTKIAKAMCKEAFGEEDEPDEKTVAILKEFLAPHVDDQILTALTAKIGARISAASKEKLGEAHQHLKAATAIVEALHGGLGDSDGEEGRSGDEEKSQSQPAPEKQRSRPAGVPGKAELDAHLLAKEVLRGVTTAASDALERLNKERRTKK